jgi:hypothetical protein
MTATAPYFGRPGRTWTPSVVDAKTWAIGRGHAAEPDVLIKELIGVDHDAHHPDRRCPGLRLATCKTNPPGSLRRENGRDDGEMMG